MPQTTLGDVAVGIVHYGDPRELTRCIESLMSAEFPLAQVIVVDNGPTYSVDPELTAKFAGVQVVSLRTNLGFAGGSNLALKVARQQNFPYTLILNPDVRVRAKTVEALRDAFVSDPAIGIAGAIAYDESGNFDFAGARVYWPRGKPYLRASEWPHDSNEPYDSGFVSGCAMMLRTELFEKLNGFSDDYFLYWEDADLCFRARAAGYRTVMVPTASVEHTGSASTGRESPLMMYYLTRNRLRFISTYCPGALMKWWLILRLTISKCVLALREALRGRPQYARAYFRGTRDFYLRRKGMAQVMHERGR